MASAMIPKVCLAVQLSPGIWCQMNLMNDGVGITVKNDKEKYAIPPTFWEAVLINIELIQSLHHCISSRKHPN